MTKSIFKNQTGYFINLYIRMKNQVGKTINTITDEYPYDTQLINSINYTLNNEGKFVRAMLLYLSYLSLNDSIDENLKFVGAGLEVMHTASLIHDDIIDNGFIRRGQISTYKKHGIPTAILTGDFLIFSSINLIAKTRYKNKYALKIIENMNKTYCNMCIGQVMENSLIGNLENDISKYMKVIELKTADFFTFICETAGLLAKSSEKDIFLLKEFGKNFGIAYQIRDDILNFIKDKEHKDKPVNSDTERRLVTLPIIFAYNNGTSEQKIILTEYFEKNNSTQISRINKILYDTGAIDKTITYINNYINKANNALSQLNGSKIKEELLSFSNTFLM